MPPPPLPAHKPSTSCMLVSSRVLLQAPCMPLSYTSLSLSPAGSTSQITPKHLVQGPSPWRRAASQQHNPPCHRMRQAGCLVDAATPLTPLRIALRLICQPQNHRASGHSEGSPGYQDMQLVSVCSSMWDTWFRTAVGDMLSSDTSSTPLRPSGTVRGHHTCFPKRDSRAGTYGAKWGACGEADRPPGLSVRIQAASGRPLSPQLSTVPFCTRVKWSLTQG